MGDGENKEKKVIGLDEALSIAGLGWYNIKYCLVLVFFSISAIVETMGYSYVLPSAKCDLMMTDSQRGFIASMAYIAIVMTSFAWGYLVDTIGRKTALIYSSLVGGMFGILASFMPEIISFALFKFIAALCMACPAAAPYTLIGEILPKQHRDIALSITTAMQILGSGLVPILAWVILPTDLIINFGVYDFRSWRLLSVVYSATLLISAGLMSFGPESPTYLVDQGREDEALKVLQTMYAQNTGKSAEYYPVKCLELSSEANKTKTSFLSSLKSQSIPLLKPQYLKWIALNGYLLFGIFAVLNGLFMWVPDVINRVFTGNNADLTACQIILQGLNETTVDNSTICNDSIDELTFKISTISYLVWALVAVLTSTLLRFMGKKIFVVAIFLIFGCVCLSFNFITHSVVFAVLLSSTQLVLVAMGPVNAFAITIFPAHLRGMAIGLGMMFGRLGSIVSVNVTGLMINSACEGTFYLFGGLLLSCSLLSLTLPGFKKSNEPSKMTETTCPSIKHEQKLSNI